MSNEQTMHAVIFDRFGGPEVLQIRKRPAPRVAPGTVLIEVRAAGVSPVDLSLRAGVSPSAKTLVLPHVPGVDAAGVVLEVGDGVEDVAVGDEVFGITDIRTLGGATGEFALLHMWAKRPAEFACAEAGAAGTSVETATRALDLLDPAPGSTLLVTGAAGGVGAAAVQLGIARGVTVIGAGRAVTHSLIAELGATPIDTEQDMMAALSRAHESTVESTIDTIGGMLPELVAVSASPSRVVTTVDYAAAEVGARFTGGLLAGQRDGRHGLAVAAALAAQGRFRVPLNATYAPFDAPSAHAAAARHPRWGKVAIYPFDSWERPAVNGSTI